MDADVVVVGAGIAGLTCAGRLAAAGLRVIVLEKSRGVGGRCATRRAFGTVVDHGLTFFHGSDEALRSTLLDVAGHGAVVGWPVRIRGSGVPCQPSAFRPGEWRLAMARGMTEFPKYLAQDLDLRTNERITAVRLEADRWRIEGSTGLELTAKDVLLCIPPPQALGLLRSWSEPPRAFESMAWLLDDVGFVSSLTVIAAYPGDVPVPDWHMWYPGESGILHLVSHDSSKRQQPDRTVLVLQALPVWSNIQWKNPDGEWSAAMLDEAGGLVGSWAAKPQDSQSHRWRYARIGSGGDLSGPMLFDAPGRCRIGFAGDAFAPGGGVQAAWRSGRRLADRVLEEQPS